MILLKYRIDFWVKRSSIIPSKPALVHTLQFAASKQMPDCIRPTYLPIEPRLSNQITNDCCMPCMNNRISRMLMCVHLDYSLHEPITWNISTHATVAICPLYYWASNVALQPQGKNQSIVGFHGKRFYVQGIVGIMNYCGSYVLSVHSDMNRYVLWNDWIGTLMKYWWFPSCVFIAMF